MPSLPRKKTIMYQGKKTRVYSIGYFANAVKRSNDTVRRWEKGGFIPTPLFKLKGSRLRWYTALEINGLAAIFRRANVRSKVPIEDTTFKKEAAQFNRIAQAKLKDGTLYIPPALEFEEATDAALKAKSEARLKQELDSILIGLNA